MGIPWLAWWLLLGSWGLTRLALPGVVDLLSRGGAVRQNYRGTMIPTAVGLAPMLGATLAMVPVGLAALPGYHYYELLLVIWVMGLVGLLDDLAGNRENRGFKGHLGQLRRGRLTTGGLKALIGGVLALLLVTARGLSGQLSQPGTPDQAGLLGLMGLQGLEGLLNVLLDVPLLALAANSLNLMDARPGRAVKVFLVLAIALVWSGGGIAPAAYLLALVGAVLAYAPLDLRAAVMMGDTGANVLGMALGLAASWLLPLEGRAAVVLLLIGMHWYLEGRSFSVVVEKNRLLRFLDGLGRKVF